MKKETEILKIKNIAKNLLKFPIEPMDFPPMMVSHPFTNSAIIPLPNEDKLLNLTDKNDFKFWQSLIEKQIDNCSNINELYAFINTAYKFAFFELISDCLSLDDYSSLLGTAYTNTDNPNEVVTKARLLSLFKKAMPKFLMTKSELSSLQKTPQNLTIYRATKTSKKNDIETLSWTTNYDVAKFFAERHIKKGNIYKANINKKHILAYFNRRNENEVVVDYHFLENISLVNEIDDNYENNN